MFETAIGQTRRPWRRRVVLNLGHFDFDIVSDFDIRISDFSLPDKSLCNNMLPSTQLCGFVVPGGKIMTTEARIHANRLNAQKSTGPPTPQGKAVVSQNALKHGLSARHDVITTESQADFHLHPH